MPSLLYQRKFQYPFIFILILICYSSLLFPHKNFDIDFNILVTPLKQIQNLSQYFTLFVGKNFVDVQPVRDISYLLDLQILKLFPSFTSIYYLTNIIIFYIATIGLLKIIEIYSSNTKNNTLVILLFAIYPTFSFVISQISARKHLLAFVFMINTIYNSLIFIKKMPHSSKSKILLSIKISLFYLLSVFSQPIGLLFPLFFIALIYIQDKKSKDLLIVGGILIFLMLFTFAINLYYYDVIYPASFGVPKFSVTPSIIKRLLAFSRSMTQILLPFSFSTNYTHDSFLNFLGLPLFIFLIFYITAQLPKKETLCWILLIFLALAPVTLKDTNIFVSDTYLLIPSVSFFLLIATLLKDIHFQNLKFKAPVILFIFSLIGLKTFNECNFWYSDIRIAKISYEREPNCKTSLARSLSFFNQKKKEDFINQTNQIIKNNCFFIGTASYLLSSKLFTYYIYWNNDPISKKIEDLNKIKLKTIDHLLAIGSLQATLKNKKEEELLLKDLDNFINHPQLRPLSKEAANVWMTQTRKIKNKEKLEYFL